MQIQHKLFIAHLKEAFLNYTHAHRINFYSVFGSRLPLVPTITTNENVKT